MRRCRATGGSDKLAIKRPQRYGVVSSRSSKWELVALGTSATSTGATTRGTAAGGEARVEEGVSGRKGRQDSPLPHLSTYQHVVHGAFSSQPGKIAVDKSIVISRQIPDVKSQTSNPRSLGRYEN
jgi:hypothetical protein